MTHFFCSDKAPDEFSWKPCELCKSTLGGERHTIVEMDDNFNGEELEVCVDCFLEIAGLQ
jgi:ribosome-binding protein aMBF1 (putative translation factor)